MEPIADVVRAAKGEVLAHNIESTRGLHAYLLLHGGETGVAALQEEAVRQGLYLYMGLVYSRALRAALDQARRCILARRITADGELRHYLENVALTLEHYRDLDLVENDLLIDARQMGLYSLMAQLQPSKELSHANQPRVQQCR